MADLVFNQYKSCLQSSITGAGWQKVTPPAGLPVGSGNADVTVVLSCVNPAGTGTGSLAFAIPDQSTAPIVAAAGVALFPGAVISLSFNNNLYVNLLGATDQLLLMWLF